MPSVKGGAHSYLLIPAVSNLQWSYHWHIPLSLFHLRHQLGFAGHCILGLERKICSLHTTCVEEGL